MAKGLGVNVKKKKMMINSKTAEKITEKSKFPCAVCRKGVENNSILCLFCRCWEHKRCSGIRGKLKEDRKFKWQTCGNQQTDVTKDFPGIELNK